MTICIKSPVLRIDRSTGLFHFQGNTDSIVARFHSWIFIQSKESSDANSELCIKIVVKSALRSTQCFLICKVSSWACRPLIVCERGSTGSAGSTGSVRRIKI